MRIFDYSRKLPQSFNLLFKKKIIEFDKVEAEKNALQNRRKKRQ